MGTHKNLAVGRGRPSCGPPEIRSQTRPAVKSKLDA